MEEYSGFERKLYNLFEYQKFNPNPYLADVINEARGEVGVYELEDDDMAELYAAGKLVKDVEKEKLDKLTI